MRLIDADKLIHRVKVFIADAIHKGIDHLPSYDTCNPVEFLRGYERGAMETGNLVLGLPTIDPEELRPKGRWVDKMVRDWHCSECGKKVPRQVHFDGYCYEDKLNYCPNCGAKMEGGAAR